MKTYIYRALLVAFSCLASPMSGFGQSGSSDPDGTIIMNLRNASNGNTILSLPGGGRGDSLKVDNANNLMSFGDLKLSYAGTVYGLADIDYRGSTSGMVSSVALEPGDGYIVRNSYNGTVGRIYVVRWIISATDSKSILGAQIKYQYPWEWRERAEIERAEIERAERAKAKQAEIERAERAKAKQAEVERAEIERSYKEYLEKEYIVINGLKWDTKNTTKGSEEYFKWKDAKALAKSVNKRLPTRKEFEALDALGSTWDGVLKGRWFGEDHALKSSSKKSVFFPAAGYRKGSSGALLYYLGNDGHYWSSSSGCYLYFDSPNVGPINGDRTYGYSVRCVAE